MIKRVYVDPPSGYLYGFPKAVPDEFVEDGKIVDKAGYEAWLNEHCQGESDWVRMWVQEEKEENN